MCLVKAKASGRILSTPQHLVDIKVWAFTVCRALKQSQFTVLERVSMHPGFTEGLFPHLQT